MTNTLTILVLVAVVGVVVADQMYWHLDLHILAGRLLLKVIDWMAVWR